MKKHKLSLSGEAVYLLAVLLMSFSVAMISAADLGVSMLVVPTFVLNERLTALTFGQCEYLVQGLVFALFCVLMGRVKAIYFASFLTCLLYGAALDLWRLAVPVFNPSLTQPGSMALPLRWFFLLAGMLLTSLSVALFYHTYLYPHVLDFFPKGVCAKYGLNLTRFRIGFDLSFLVLGALLSLLFFRRFLGIGVGTLLMTALNGLLIGFFGRAVESCLEITPACRALAEKFAL